MDCTTTYIPFISPKDPDQYHQVKRESLLDGINDNETPCVSDNLDAPAFIPCGEYLYSQLFLTNNLNVAGSISPKAQKHLKEVFENIFNDDFTESFKSQLSDEKKTLNEVLQNAADKTEEYFKNLDEGILECFENAAIKNNAFIIVAIMIGLGFEEFWIQGRIDACMSRKATA